VPTKNVLDSILQIKKLYEEGTLENKMEFNNLLWMQNQGLANVD
jgi:hypothetical protein